MKKKQYPVINECKTVFAQEIEPGDIIWVPFHDAFCQVEVIVKDFIGITFMFIDKTNYITCNHAVFLRKNNDN